MILLVEDDPADSRLIQRALAKAELTEAVLRLTNGEDAVAYLRGDDPYDNRRLYPLPSMILLDIKLPKRNGFEVLEWLRKQLTELRRIPVIMLTSSRHAVDVNRAYDLGVNSYLVKPDNSDQMKSLARLVRDYWTSANETPTIGIGGAV